LNVYIWACGKGNEGDEGKGRKKEEWKSDIKGIKEREETQERKKRRKRGKEKGKEKEKEKMVPTSPEANHK